LSCLSLSLAFVRREKKKKKKKKKKKNDCVDVVGVVGVGARLVEGVVGEKTALREQ